ncbi:hypothetical protein TNCV_812291 [Trichonephila clavipes]|nr:hypothetical protein TNCV_812291 [Trichonephila clavipes]
MLQLLYGKCSAIVLTCTFTRFLASRKRLSNVAKRLARSHTPVTKIDELWHHVEAAWASVPVHIIQSLSDSMPRRISALITARGGCSGYWISWDLCTKVS